MRENNINSSVSFNNNINKSLSNDFQSDEYVIKKDSVDNNDNNVNNNQNNDVDLSQKDFKGLKTQINSFIHPQKRNLSNSDARMCLTNRTINDLLKMPFGVKDFNNKDSLMAGMGKFFHINFEVNLKLFKRELVYNIISSYPDKYCIAPGARVFPTGDIEWTDFVNAVSVKLPEKDDDDVFKVYAYEKLLTAAGLIAATIKTPNTETYNWAFNDKGRIIFSNNAKNNDKKVVNVSWTFDDKGKLTPASTLSDVDEMTVKLREFLNHI